MNRESMRMIPYALGLACVAGSAAVAQPTAPVYTGSISDCITADNVVRGGDGARYWFVDPGCDIYQTDLYERPTPQTYRTVKRKYAAAEIFQYIDITDGQWGYDSRYLYVAIDLFGRNHITSDNTKIPRGMVERYGFRFSNDPDGRYGILVVADQPELKNSPKTKYGRIGTFAYLDENGDVGGASDGPTGVNVTKSDNSDEEDGMNGYETPIISDGRLSDETTVLWVRISPTDNTVVEFALDYSALGFTEGDIAAIRSLEIEAIKGDPKDPQNYRWNDKYTKVEAGSPNKGPGGMSEFGTNGLQAVYECDTARAQLGLRSDFTDDGGVDSADVVEFFSLWAESNTTADVNGDARIDADDLRIVLDSQN